MHEPTKRAEDVLGSWNRCHGAFYQVRECDLLWNQNEQRLLRYWKDVVAGGQVLWAEAAPEGAALGIPTQGIWLSLYGEITEGKEAAFAEAVEEYARAREKGRLGIAGEEFHFLPGIPVGESRGERLAEAFRARGFSTADSADFLGDPQNTSAALYTLSAEKDAEAKGWSLRQVENKKDKEELSAFMSKEFPGRWTREWITWGARTDTGRAFWNLLRDEKDVVLGFSRLAVRGRCKPPSSGWTPGAMRLPLRSSGEALNTDSCLGPIGVAKEERGRGAGKILLGLSLKELSLQGAKQVCIDWTNAYNYYTPLGFSIARRYLSVWKEF